MFDDFYLHIMLKFGRVSSVGCRISKRRNLTLDLAPHLSTSSPFYHHRISIGQQTTNTPTGVSRAFSSLLFLVMCLRLLRPSAGILRPRQHRRPHLPPPALATPRQLVRCIIRGRRSALRDCVAAPRQPRASSCRGLLPSSCLRRQGLRHGLSCPS